GALCRERGATLFMGLAAGLASLLSRFADQDRVAIGTPIANRTRPETEALIGFFVNTLVLPIDLAGGGGLGALVESVRETCLGAYAHQDLPFERLVEEVAPRRDLAGSPLFQVLLALQNAPLDLALPGLAVEPLESANETAKLDLALSFAEGEGGLGLGIEYAAEILDAATVERWAGALERLLEAAVEEPEAPLVEIPLIAPAEQLQIARLGDGGLAVLDRLGLPVPFGVIGRLHAGNSEGDGGRLVDTGRLARLLPDGTFEDYGPIERRVEIGGVRVRLDEIEARLLELPGVREAAVDTRRAGSGELRVAAWLVAEGEIEPAALRHALHGRIPEAAIPAAWQAEAELPRTPEGGIDRAALATPPGLDAERARTAPATAVQKVIAEVWRELLEIEHVAIEDSFFELGGHSLLAVQLASKIGASFQVDLPLKRLFEEPTVAGLEAAVLAAEARPGQSEKIARVLLRLQSLSPEAKRALLKGGG